MIPEMRPPVGIDRLVRLGGASSLLPKRIDQMRTVISDEAAMTGEMLTDAADAILWATVREFGWVPPEMALVKVATTASKLAALETALSTQPVARRYAVGGNLLWLAWPTDLEMLDALLVQHELSGLVMRGSSNNPLIGVRCGQAFAQRIKQALDPHQRFPTF